VTDRLIKKYRQIKTKHFRWRKSIHSTILCRMGKRSLPARRYASASLCDSNVSVRPSQNGKFDGSWHYRLFK